VKEHKINGKKECMCEVIVRLPQGTLTAKESTMNMFAAVDIVEEKIKIQAKKYKEKQRVQRGGRLRAAFRKLKK
jgi:ribosomal subunit interface protein